MNDELFFTDRKELREWLEVHHNNSRGLWVVFTKGKDRSLSYDDMVEEALCFGWIDSKPGLVDDTKSKLYISPRNPKSNWSKLNKERIAKLDKLNLITQAGLDMINIAKGNGRWNALDVVDKLIYLRIYRKNSINIRKQVVILKHFQNQSKKEY